MTMQCHLNGVHISEVPTILAESPSVTTHAVELTDPFNVAHLLIIPLQLSNGTSYFDVYTLSVAEYENEDILRFISLLKILHGIHQQRNIQAEIHIC